MLCLLIYDFIFLFLMSSQDVSLFELWIIIIFLLKKWVKIYDFGLFCFVGSGEVHQTAGERRLHESSNWREGFSGILVLCLCKCFFLWSCGCLNLEYRTFQKSFVSYLWFYVVWFSPINLLVFNRWKWTLFHYNFGLLDYFTLK